MIFADGRNLELAIQHFKTAQSLCPPGSSAYELSETELSNLSQTIRIEKGSN
jgi:hypothetical protein